MILRGLVSASNGMQALINQNDSTANNVANVNTVGFKKQSLVFQNIYDTNVYQKSAETGDMTSIGSLSVGSQVQKLTYDFTQGSLNKTGGVFDIAIAGDGFLKVQSNDGGYAYTRNGSLTLNNNGTLVTKDGEAVLDHKGKPIKINTNGVVMRSLNDIIIEEDGQITLCNDRDQVMLQKIGIYDFQNKEDLVNLGGSKFKPTDTRSNPEVIPTKYKIEQGSLEMSNANIVNEMIQTISTSRNYETLSKLVKENGESLTNAFNAAKL